MFDTHSHIQFKVFKDNLEEILAKAEQEGIQKIIACGTNIESSQNAVYLSGLFDSVYAVVGIHPHHVFEHFHAKVDLFEHLEKIEEHLKDPKVVGVGETGLDRHGYPNTKYQNYTVHEDFFDLQRQIFEKQIKLAVKYKKSLVIHNRGAALDLLEILRRNWDESLEERSVFHCSEPDLKLLDFAKTHHIFIGVDGDVTYDTKKQEFAKEIPLNLLVMETDSPFFVPEPLKFEGIKTNEPANLKIISKKIAELKKIDLEIFENQVYQNSLDLFGL